jgi:hypothetical protein
MDSAGSDNRDHFDSRGKIGLPRGAGTGSLFGRLLQKGLAAQSDDGRSLRIVTTRIGLRS